ncbi:signal peptidase I [Enterococcus sp. LJL128]
MESKGKQRRKNGPPNKQLQLQQKKKNRKRPKRPEQQHQSVNLVSNALFLVFVLCCIFFFLRIKTHQVDGQSMSPTLENQDRIFVFKKQLPNRYDLVTFQPGADKKESYVKRVIGMPGDTIWVEGTSLFINQQITEGTVLTDGSATEMPDGTLKVNLSESLVSAIQPLSVIPAGHYFVLGDNRNHSKDSRALGFIKEEQLEGVVLYRYYPFTKLGRVN